MVFKRRTPRSLPEWAREMVYPKGGFRRATQYVMHRMRRLPDQPERVARGFAAGVFISFTPFFGFHFLGSVAIAWALRGNILAALLGTFVGNPVTTPIIAITSVGLGQWMLGIPGVLELPQIGRAFAQAGTQLWANASAIFTDKVMHWDRLIDFFREIYLPYMIGGILPGIAVSLIFYWLTVPLVRAYQRMRANQAAERAARRLACRPPRE
ncbi:DUF2062 domain-containing protein [Falsirhodobacter sp. 20TX0035]|uniref:DUF2062 domain-containing protein n=1 Tax=Falsirhodobacter sp. 20TX0035 TaxID=3022019 RepID=UPI00232E32B8|nr:DUF2062 domain-containing protein [Falsirhodobacter sp. 20TX0035]MDB6454587.1 DUF2062 domain-containing protein [Falsirhodobacter sp. 20TX0035]